MENSRVKPKSIEVAVERPERLRMFVALFPPPELVGTLSRVQDQLGKDLSEGAIRWTRPDQIHLTVQFLGAVASERLEEFKGVISSAAERTAPFTLVARGLGAFPSQKAPRILWAGLEGDLAPLEQLQELVASVMEKSGIPREERAFHPHLTIGRVIHLNFRGAELVRKLVSVRVRERFGEWMVKEVQLMRSVLSPAGAKYQVLSCSELAER
jgi:RNA 2',3'-cyclic 3'-phosphodiesterase